jgi:hypothetical protein
MDPPLYSRKHTSKYGMDTSDTASQKEVSNSTTGRKSDVESFQRCTWPIPEHYQESGTTVNSIHYNKMIQN